MARRSASAALLLLLSLVAAPAATIAQSALAAPPFALGQFSFCGIRQLQDLPAGATVRDSTYRPNSNTLRTVLVGSNVVYEHDLKGNKLRELPFTTLPVGIDFIGIDNYFDSEVATLDERGALVWAEMFPDLTVITQSDLSNENQILATEGVTPLAGLAYSRDYRSFYFHGRRGAYSGPIAMDERRSVLTIPQNQGLAELEGIVTSYVAADRDNSLFMLRADNGNIYKVPLEGFDQGNRPELVAQLSTMTPNPLPAPRLPDEINDDPPLPGRGRHRRALRQFSGLDFTPAGMGIRGDGTLLSVVADDARIIYYCADPLERRTGDDGEELDGFEFDNRSDYDDFDYYDEPLDDEFNPELDFVRRGDSTDDEPGFSRNGGVPSPPSNSASPQTAIDFLTQLIGQLPSFVVSQEDGNPEFEVLGTGNRP
eukprot:jgi/Tetstr1/445399/TSEL_033183.t1